MRYFDNCERSEEMRGCELRSVPRKNLVHSLYCRVVISCNGLVFELQGVEPCLNRSVQSHGMR